MTAEEIANTVQGELVCASEKKCDITTACGSDMMSDVMAFYHDGGLLITGLINIQVVRTASLLDLAGICFVRGKKITDEMKTLAKENGLFIVETKLSLFMTCGKLFEAGLKGASINNN